RSTLAGLLWPDHPEELARTNLRHVLRQLRQTLPDFDGSVPLLLTSHQTIRINPQSGFFLDVARFDDLWNTSERCSHRTNGSTTQAECPACIERYTQMAALYRGEFLEGLTLQDSD